MKVGFMCTTLKQHSNTPVEVSILTLAEESAASEKQREVNADLLFRHWLDCP
jgi:hypothetical protein